MKPKVRVRFDFVVRMMREHRRRRPAAEIAVRWAQRWIRRTLKNVPTEPGMPYGKGITCNVWLSDSEDDYFIRNQKHLRVELTW